MKRIVFMGTPDFAVPILEALVEAGYDVVLAVTQPDRPVGRKQELKPSPVKVTAEKLQIPVFQPEKIAADYKPILDCNADIIITAAYGQLLPKVILDAPPFGCINVHASLLPELRGGAPIHYAILQGKKETGITIMYMAEKLDAGDIISQAKIAISDEDDVGTLHDRLAKLGASLLINTLPEIFKGTNARIKQDEAKATYAPNITRELERINWERSHEEVFNHIRGLRPWPVAYTLHEGKRVKIWRADKNPVAFAGEPGEIVAVGIDYITVRCGDGNAVNITEIQPAGKKKMQVATFLRGNPQAFKRGQKLE